MIRLLLMMLVLAAPLGAAEITLENVVAQMNLYREAAGLEPFRTDDRLIRVADLRMQDMTELAYWGHVSPDGRSPFELLRPTGYVFQAAGENLAAGFETAELLVQSWMESRGHRENILSHVFQECGVSILEGSTTGRAMGRSVVVTFGRQLTSR